MGGMVVVGIPILLIFLIMNSGIPTMHEINITVVVGIPLCIYHKQLLLVENYLR